MATATTTTTSHSVFDPVHALKMYNLHKLRNPNLIYYMDRVGNTTKKTYFYTPIREENRLVHPYTECTYITSDDPKEKRESGPLETFLRLNAEEIPESKHYKAFTSALPERKMELQLKKNPPGTNNGRGVLVGDFFLPDGSRISGVELITIEITVIFTGIVPDVKSGILFGCVAEKSVSASIRQRFPSHFNSIENSGLLGVIEEVTVTPAMREKLRAQVEAATPETEDLDEGKKTK